jgi:prolyl-tRNA editing enzyme YbaK/EbsC (Cys-tRNA(Pro) deacylase)
MPVYVQSTIYDLPEIYINAGHRGVLVAIEPATIDAVLGPLVHKVDVMRD